MLLTRRRVIVGVRKQSSSINQFLTNDDGGSRMKKFLPFIAAGVILLAIIMVTTLIGVTTIEGNERAVVQDWNDGVLPELWADGTHFYMPLTTTPHVYHVGAQRFIIGNGKEGDVPAFKVTTGGTGNEQPATFHATLQYSLDTTKLVALHNKCNTRCEAGVIKNTLTRIISNQATQLKVLDFYSGEGRKNLQDSIEREITSNAALANIGIVVENFVFDKIVLDKQYVSKIRERQLAFQDKLKNIEEAKAAQENAKKIEAIAQADKLKKIVEAEAKKQERIKAAEAQAEEVTLAAKADAAKIKAKASAERYRKEQDAKGLLAQGLAEAKVAKEKRDSKYSGVSGERQANVEINKARVGMFKNMKINGVLPEGSLMNFIQGNTGNTVLPLPTNTK